MKQDSSCTNPGCYSTNPGQVGAYCALYSPLIAHMPRWPLPVVYRYRVEGNATGTSILPADGVYAPMATSCGAYRYRVEGKATGTSILTRTPSDPYRRQQKRTETQIKPSAHTHLPIDLTCTSIWRPLLCILKTPQPIFT